MEGLEKDEWLSVGYIPVDTNTPNGLAENHIYIANLGNLQDGDIFRVAKEGRGMK